MHRETRFLISRRPYAVDLNSLRIETRTRYDGEPYYEGRINAVWYRRRKGVTYACIGTLWDIQHDLPRGGAEFLARHDDGRYGGDCHGRWDGTRYWGAQVPEVTERHLLVLRPMLDHFPTVPEGYDGWWTFHPPRARRS
ncbi:hypothetical protein [Nocardiopsis rhodophaea]|uniref:hypothetical protein n=1 Tax=Nocardiopsis rhodophaea TaxID=280238 RepID=UPI0031D975E8